MTRKDFELIASVVKRTREYQLPIQLQTLDALTCNFADELATTNPRFDRDKFLRACGLDPNFEE